MNILRDENGVKGLTDLCCHVREAIGKNLLVVEIGSAIGESAYIFAGHFARVVCIDLWPEERQSFELRSGAAEQLFDRMAATMNGTIIKRKGASLDLAKTWQEQIDLLYIDGAHDYQSVKADIKAWGRCVRVGGFICGHDFEDPVYPGVAEAVLELLGEPEIVFRDRSWLVRAV